MKESKPSAAEWQDLFRAAAEFKKHTPWKWMRDNEIFAVQDPDNKEMGYCCVMGYIEEVYGLVVYLGGSGLDLFWKMQSGQISADDPDAGIIQDCLIASFEDRECLETKDRQLIKELGLRYRGRNAWPMFRRYQPGYFPWYLTREEVRFLTLSLEQALDVCLRYKENPKLLTPPRPKAYLTRVCSGKKGAAHWEDKWLKPAAPPKKQAPHIPVDEVRVQRIKKTAKNSKQIWELDLFFAPTPVKDKPKPYFPYVVMLMNHRSGFVLGVEMMEYDNYEERFQEKFLSLLQNISVIPASILVRKPDVSQLLEPLGTKLNCSIKLSDELPNIDYAKEGLLDFFANPESDDL